MSKDENNWPKNGYYHSSHLNDLTSCVGSLVLAPASAPPSASMAELEVDSVAFVESAETHSGATSASSECASNHSIAGSTPLLPVKFNAFCLWKYTQSHQISWTHPFRLALLKIQLRHQLLNKMWILTLVHGRTPYQPTCQWTSVIPTFRHNASNATKQIFLDEMRKFNCFAGIYGAQKADSVHNRMPSNGLIENFVQNRAPW